MDDKAKYIDRLLSDKKYINKLGELYNELVGIRKFRRRLEEIEKEVTWYIGTEKNGFVPMYYEFYDYAYENYIPKNADTIVHAMYKNLLGEYRSSEIPGYLYCLVLLGHLHEEENSFLQAHEKDFDSLPESVKKDSVKLHSKVKLLIGFLSHIERLVAIFINSIDMAELEYLDDDIKELDAIAVKHRFLRALQLRDKSMCFKLLGRMRDLDQGEDDYFEALAHYVNEEYDATLRYIDRVKPEDIDYKSALALKLECYSLMGNLKGFMECLNRNKKLCFNYWHFEYLLMSLILRMPMDEESDDFEENPFLSQEISFDEKPEPFYMGQLFRLVADIVVEGLGIIEESSLIVGITDDSILPDSKLKRMAQLSGSLALFPDEIKNLLDVDYFTTKDISELKNEAELALLKLLIDNNPEKNFENIKKAFLCQLHLGNTKGFLDNVENNFEALVKYSEGGETGADELMRIAYIEGAVLGTISEKVKNRIEKQEAINLTKNISDKKIHRFLSEQGRLAYEAAEWQYRKSQEEDYGWKDAGMISLSFYRILEVELNQKFIIPLLSGIGYEALNTAYTNHANTLSGDAKKQYKTKWGTILKTYQGMENNGFSEGGFMLGVLDHFFQAIGSDYDTTDALGTLIRDHLEDVLYPDGILEFENGFFETITNDTTRNKFRNPPAHTRYLSYEIACECREVFRETILQMCDMIRMEKE